MSAVPAPVDCTACGYRNRPGAKFCGSCGSAIGDVARCSACGAANPKGQKFCDACGRAFAEQQVVISTGGGRAMPTSFARGRYQVLRFLGEGVRKQVYLARDTRLEREVAVACIKQEGLDEVGVARVRREGEAMGRLGDHPHIVTVYDIGDENGQLYLVSQYMSGGDLEDLLRRAENHRLTVEETLRVADHVCRALEQAHSHGIIHRDLKPRNVWLTQDGVAKLGDFGLAVALDRSRLSTEGLMVGTVAYMPPEQGLGRGADARSDLYSLGALLYELLCGRPPFVGDDAVAIISQHINTPPVAPSWHAANVPPGLEDVILRLLAKAPEERPPSAGEVREALAAIASAPHAVTFAAREDRRALERLATSAFVGREQETIELRAALDEALSGRGRLIMLAGESGIGKTRLATELGTYASLRGAQVLWGRCYEGEGAPAYWPWVQVIRSYVHDRDAQSLSSEMGAGAADIAQVVSEVRERLPGLPEPPSLEPEQARFRLFDSIRTFLRNAAAKHPLAIILDDLHSADKPSLLLLQFLAREIRDVRLLLLGTYRDVELERHHPLSEVLAALRRERGYERVRLRGLSQEDVKGMLEAAAQQELATAEELALVEAVHRETEGNPYFIEEVVRNLVESGGIYQRDGRWVSDAQRIEELGIPEGVRDAIGRRLGRLSDESNQILAIASVIGREFRFETLELATDVEATELLELLEEAVQAGIVQEVAGELGRYSFSHAIMRQTLYGELPTSRRLALHRRIGEALEELYGDNVEGHLGELAYHFVEGAQAGDVEKAIDYAWWAGERAADLHAYEEAVGHYERALQLLELTDADPERRCELLLALGDAQWRAGATPKAQASFSQAADMARGLALPDQFARAALGYGGGPGGFGVTDRADERLMELLREALEMLPKKHSVLGVRLMSRLAVELYYADDVAERDRLSQAAVEIAERLGDTAVQLVAVYSRRWSVLGPDDLEEQLAAAAEVLRLARVLGDREMEFRGHHFRLNSLLQLGDLDGVDGEIKACARLAKELRQPLYLWQTTVFQAMRQLMKGNLEQAERLAQEAFQIGQRGHSDATAVAFSAQTFLLRWSQGRLDDLVEGGKHFASRYPRSAWPAALAFLYSELDRDADARALLELLAHERFAGLRRDVNWLGALTLLSLTAASLGDARRAEQLYELLLPYADRYPTLVAGVVTLPPVWSILGILAAAMKRWDEAAHHFERGIERSSAIGATPWMVLTQREYSKMLVDRAGERDRDKALALLSDSLERARDVGMSRVVEQLLALKLKAQGIASIDVQTSIGAVAESIHADQPDLRPATAPDGTVTLAFSDIEGSTAMNERVGDERWLEILRSHNAIVRKQVKEHRGFEVKSQGDGFMLAFASADLAVRCAIAIQRAFSGYRAQHPDVPLRVRIGLHTGEALREREDFFGRNVTLAARIADSAKGDEILVSSTLKELMAGADDVSFDHGGELQLKGLSGVHRVFGLAWQPTEPEAGRAEPVAKS